MIGETFSHYKILEKLGEGGMGVVYKAEDTQLKRTVALKFLPQELTRHIAAKERFVHEAQVASSLDHPNICTIHEIDETEDGQLFICMAYYEGETVEKKIEQGALHWEEAVDIVIQVAQGLARPHEAGIIHRDIKPANIMITKRDEVKILDFGLAKLTGKTRLTKTGTTLGTVAYMSPEQARGEEVDHRTDIWSLGVVLYEMVTGQLPFKGEYDQAVVYSIINEEPVLPSFIRKETPNHLEQIVIKALRKDLEKRYKNMQEVLKELKKPLSSIAVSEKKEKSIVVLPFEDISPGKDNEYFSDGLTEEIITDLSHIHDLLVISRSSAMTFKGSKKRIKEIAEEVNVQYVLEGSVRKAENNLRITAQLIDATTDAHLWAGKYSSILDDIFDIQEKVSRAIVDALKVQLTPEEERRIAEQPIDNVAAYECYLKANAEILLLTEDAINHALRFLQKALDIIGDNALLYSGMAWACWQLVNIGSGQEEHIKKAEEYVKKALAMDPEFPKALALLGWIAVIRGDNQAAVYHLKRALAVSPDESLALQGLAAVGYLIAGKISTAVPLYERLKQIDPLDFITKWCRGGLPFYDGQNDHALQGWRELYEFYPEVPAAQFYYALILAYQNHLKNFSFR